MKKHLTEEKQDFPVLNFLPEILLLTLFFSVPLTAQIPLNGFCDYSEYRIESGHTHSLSVDLNNDNINDLILFTPGSDSYSFLKGKKGGNYEIRNGFHFPVKITDLQLLHNSKRGTKRFAYISREQKETGILALNEKAAVKKITSIRNNYSPGTLFTADIDGDNNSECLVSGVGYDGISIFSFHKNGPVKKVITAGNVYADAIFTDINDDGFPDIIALDPLSNALEILINNSIGEFQYARSIALSETIISFAASDINNDYFTDLVISTIKGFTIYLNSEFADLKNKSTIATSYKPDKFLISDLNDDGIKDLTYFNENHHTVSVLFQLFEKNFTDELTYFRNSHVTDVITTIKEKKNTLIATDESGYLFEISRVSAFSQDAAYLFGGTASLVKFFDYENNGLPDIAYVDKDQQIIGLLIRNNAGIPERYFKIPVVHEFSDIEIDDADPFIKVFYCYTPDERIIEVIRIDLYDFDYQRDFIHTEGILKDIGIFPAQGSSRATDILAAHTKGDNLILSFFRYDGKIYHEEKISSVHQSILYAIITGDKSLYTFSTINQSQILSFIPAGHYKTEMRLQLFTKPVTPAPFERIRFFNNTEYTAFPISENGTLLLMADEKSQLFYFFRQPFSKNEYMRELSVPSENTEEESSFTVRLQEGALYRVDFDFRKSRITLEPLTGNNNRVTSFCRSIVDDFCYIGFTLENKPIIYLKKIVCAG